MACDPESTRKWSAKLDHWKHEFAQSKKILVPVLTNQVLTLLGWYYVYDCETDPDSPAYYLLDKRRNYTTGNDVYDGALNGAFCITLLAMLSFFMLIVAIYNFTRLIQCWLSLSCLLIVFGISSMFFRDALKALDYPSVVLTLAMAFVYGVGGAFTFFNPKAPLVCHQVYVVCNCALVSLYYLRLLPAHTAWFLLGAIIAWDAFAVLAPQGPLNMITGCADNYSDSILRFLMFTAEIPVQAPPATANRVDEQVKQAVECFLDSRDGELDDSDCSTAKNMSQDSVLSGASSDSEQDGADVVLEKEPFERTAKDALNDDNSIRLGLGDFVFYSVLVGKAASSGSIPATIAAMVGVMLGLLITLTVFSDSDDTMPALPCSVALGMTMHFTTLYLFEPGFYQYLEPYLHHLVYL